MGTPHPAANTGASERGEGLTGGDFFSRRLWRYASGPE